MTKGYFSLEKMQNRFPFVTSQLPLPEQDERDGSLLIRAFNSIFDHLV